MNLSLLLTPYSLLLFSIWFVPNQTENDCDNIPALNQEVVKYVSTKIKKKVGRGECWDLAYEALETVGAEWDKRYKFGEKVDYKTECIYPGDIMQFENVKVVYKQENRVDYEEFPHHTAIIYEVKGKGNYVLAHQNSGRWGRKVGTSDHDMSKVTKGKITIYRPTQ